MHPKIAQVLLERQRPDMALAVLKCTWRDRFSASATVEKDGMASLCEAVTAVRVRIEYGHLTEAFMYHRAYCSRVKEQISADTSHVEDATRSSWIYHVEVMMTEFCNICIERKYVDKMIELPWGSEEEKHIHKSLVDCVHERPTEPCASLLVVYYLRVNILYSCNFSHHEHQINCCSENLRIQLMDIMVCNLFCSFGPFLIYILFFCHVTHIFSNS
jgi:E3 ubiquitin-protein ligase HOS1